MVAIGKTMTTTEQRTIDVQCNRLTREYCCRFGNRLPLSLLRSVPHKPSQKLGFRAYNKALKLQRVCRVARTYFGSLVECELTDLIQMCIYHFGVWEPHLSALIECRLWSGDTFCDVGANVGYHTLLGSSLVGHSGKVIAIEASPITYGKLIKNLDLNHSTNVETAQVAIISERREVTIYKGKDYNIGEASVVVGEEPEAMVQGISLSDALTAVNRARLKLIKIDIEGSELAVLRELADSIHSYSDKLEILVEVWPKPGLDDVFAKFKKLGFTAWAVENSYDVVEGYLNFDKARAPIRLSNVPMIEQDVFFSRSYPG
jgi:FkbM family methyltransferase